MVCTLCDSKTFISNSRYRRSNKQTWRRHTCRRCSAVYTTRESIDMSYSYRVEKRDGGHEPFSSDKLYVSVLESLQPSSDRYLVARQLTDTVLAQIVDSKRLIIPIDKLTSTVYTTLKRFDNRSGILYAAKRPTVFSSPL